MGGILAGGWDIDCPTPLFGMNYVLGPRPKRHGGQERGKNNQFSCGKAISGNDLRSMIKQFVVGCVSVLAAGCIMWDDGKPITVEHTRSSEGAGGEKLIYCGNCGVIAGKSTKCPGFTSHRFLEASGSGKVICGHCGGTPMETPYPCPQHVGHHFKVMGR